MRLRRVWRPRYLGDRDSIRAGTDTTSQLNTRVASHYDDCGCLLPATDFAAVAQRCSSVAGPFFRNPGSDDIDAVQRKHRNEQMTLEPMLNWCQTWCNPGSGLSDQNVGSSSVTKAIAEIVGYYPLTDQGCRSMV